MAIGRVQDQGKGLNMELPTGISQSHGLAMNQKGPIRDWPSLIVIAILKIVIPAYKSPSELAFANTVHPDVKRSVVSFINIVSGLTYADLVEDELSTKDTYSW